MPGLRRNAQAAARSPSQKAAFWNARRRADQRRGAVEVVQEELLGDEAVDQAEETKIRCNQTLDFFNLAREMHVPLDMLKDAFELFKDHAFCQMPGDLAPAQEADSGQHYRLAFEGHLTKKEFGKVLCDLAGCDALEDLPDGLVFDNFTRADQNLSETIDFLEFAGWFVRHGFSEDMLLSKEELYIRKVARSCNMPQNEVDRYRKMFHEFDIDGNDEIDSNEFKVLLHKLLKVPAHLEFPASRIRQFWQEVDMDGSGSVNFEEFLVFYRKYFNLSQDGRCPVEDFYQSFRHVSVAWTHP